MSEFIDWQHPKIMECAKQIASGHETPTAIAKACFEWVRDEIRHSYDYQMSPVTCRASDVLQHKTGGVAELGYDEMVVGASQITHI
ncbi:MAG: hypothetical protein JGK30_08515 [Microcoleus sp. PH2017_40_RAT_O_B]|uniref:transglutaminase-like domain-containing protein n=1 Tax=unclassified Microcoleus TaxID=2642155 RepID=UPI001DC0B77E|nr:MULTISPECIES: hypothetical protein [unclassified Microcoleus]MCC3571935.1 hypothetical protein [Microcoleus sp. PH2017_34_RAT_O_A]MCC3609545.1 hypothetical protein [Microcoleus sp. PH2017_40_RAT_O_B]